MFKCICNKVSDKETDKEKLTLIGSKCGKCVCKNKENEKTKHCKAV